MVVQYGGNVNPGGTLVKGLFYCCGDVAGTLHSVTLVQAGPEAVERWRFADGSFALH